jgi:hypothetical protein
MESFKAVMQILLSNDESPMYPELFYWLLEAALPALTTQIFQVSSQKYKTRATDITLTINEKNILAADRKCQMSCLSKKSKISQGWL